MKKILALFLSICMLIPMLTLLSSCGKHEATQSISVYYTGNIYDFDPALNFTNDEAVKVMNLIYDPLFEIDNKGRIEGVLISKWKFDEKTNKLTLTLRDTCWNDNSEILGEDVIYAWKRILACDFESEAAPLLFDIENAYECKNGMIVDGKTITQDDLGIEVDVKDRKTIIVTLKEGADYEQFLRNLTNIAVTALDEDAIAGQDSYWAKRSSTIHTSGPFSIKEINYNLATFRIGRNNYYRVKADINPEKIDLTKYVLPFALSTDWVTADNSVSKGVAASTTRSTLGDNQAVLMSTLFEDFIEGLSHAYKDTIFYMGELSLMDRLTAKEENAKVVTCVDTASTYSYMANLINPASDVILDKDVRVALSKIIDREVIAETVVFGKPATGLIAPVVYNTDYKTSFRETADAKATLIAKTAEASALAELKTAVNKVTQKLTDEGIEYPKSSTNKPIIKLIIHDSEEEGAIANAVKNAVSSVIQIEINYLAYTYIDEKVSADTLVEADTNTMLVDSIAFAYQRQSDGGHYFYKYNDTKRATPQKFDLIGLDFQMLSTSAFAALTNFSSNYNGFGIDTSEKDGEFSYSSKKALFGWQNDEYDALIASAYAEKDVGKKVEYLHQAEELLLSEMPIIPIIFNQNFAVINPALKGITTTNFYGYFDMVRAEIKGLSKYEERDKG